MQLTTLALAFSEWGIGRFPLDLIVFLSIALIFALPAGLNRIKSPCALQSCNVDYTSEGTYMTFPDGTMVSYVMNLSFMELEPIYADEYDEVDASQEQIGY